MKTYITILLLCCILFSSEGIAQEAYISGIEYSYKNLTPLLANQNWESPSFVSKYKKFIVKADLYIKKLTKEYPNHPKLAILSASYKKFDSPYRSKVVVKADSKKIAAEVANQAATSKIEKQMQAQRKLAEEQRVLIMQKHKDFVDNLYPPPVKSQGIENDFHQANLDKIRFGIYNYGEGSSELKSQFSISDGFNHYIFLEDAIYNMALKQQEKTQDKRWYAKSENAIKYRLYANNKLIQDWIEISPSAKGFDETATFFADEVIPKKQIDVNYSSGFYRYIGQKFIVEQMKPGTYNMKVEAFLTNYTIGEENEIKLAEGSFTLSATDAELKKFIKDRNQLKKVPRTVYNQCNSSMIIEKVRRKYSGEKKTYKPGKITSGSYDEGDKLYVINPSTGSRRFLMTISKGTQSISFGCN